LLACTSPEPDMPVSEFKAILMERAELEKSIKLVDPQPLVNAGKIYIKDHLLFINEKYRGVHVYDNSNPAQPEILGFITIPGNIDISVDGNIIYADNAVDLVAFNYDGNTIQMLDRNRDIFPELSPPDLPGSIPYEYTKEQRPDNTVIVRWE
ncbi:MAG: hypothetical protein ACPF9D_13920, partial [Owenweeksia sp.]